MNATDDARLLATIRGCTACTDLPHGPRPVLQFSSSARIVVLGQAPGRRVHESGVPWDDPSGVRLRDWLGVDDATFYDPGRLALVPMGFCYPGTGTSGDLPPRPECAPLWHDALLDRLAPGVLRVVLGQYARARYVPGHGNLTEAVMAWRDLLPGRVVLPHPSPCNNRWLTRNPWFEQETLPALRRRVAEVLA